MKLPLKNITRLLIKAKEKENNERLIKRWLIGGYEREMSFDDFKGNVMTSQKADNKTEEEILTDVKKIIDTFNKKVVE